MPIIMSWESYTVDVISQKEYFLVALPIYIYCASAYVFYFKLVVLSLNIIFRLLLV